MSAKAHGERLLNALVVAGVCAAVFFWAGRGGRETIGVLALLVGSGASLVVGFSALALIFGGLAHAAELPAKRARAQRYRAEAAARDERRRRLEASRERHLANRATWLRGARAWIAKEGPAWQGGNRDAFVWLRARLGKAVKVREREEDRVQRYHWGYTGYTPNVGDPESVEPGEWKECTWVVELPDDALTAKQYEDRIDESDIVVRWRAANAATLPLENGKVTVDAKGIEIRVPHEFQDLNDLDYGHTGTYSDVIRIED